ncbi:MULTISPECIES: cyclophilin-like fold protein [Atopobiaceae]|uniref:Cyclophilin-like n=1 Tax=Parafannyhessea umbonata TaxID=604330 RepID=A0A1H6JNM0_9ACTN|nr:MULTISPECIES: cyclophilin-like fold protein [Atopobiaceae]SEH63673.1 Cyclophilin-like [Parafannyhessea umbonata]SJZ83534.1 Cyclophilin-like [Olsenella sp. KH1P3]
MAIRVNLRFEDVSVPAELNDTETALAFAQKLPASIRVSGTGIDFCGRMPFELPYEESQVGRGWNNGDVNYSPGGGWFAILFDDEENSSRYGDQVNMGHVTGPLDVLHGLSGSYDLIIERA